jgi:hypothetical protein
MESPSRGIAVVVLLAAVAVALLAMILMGGALAPSAGVDASSTPSAHETVSSGGPTPEPSSSVMPTATPEPPAPLQPDTVAYVTVNDLILRDAPSSGGMSLGHLLQGGGVFVLEGPEQTDGFGWYQVAIVDDWRFTPSSCSDGCADAQIGWVAGISDRQEAWLAPSDLECPADPKREAVAALDPIVRLACYSGQSLTLKGVVKSPCCRYVGALTYTPRWIAWPTNRTYLETFALALRFDPRDGLAVPERGDVIRVTGHFDDPAAENCTITIDESALANDPSLTVDPQLLAYAPLACRQQFVVDSIKVLGGT